MGIEDPIWGRLVVVLCFIAILLGILYFSKYKGKQFFAQISNYEFLKLEETISISNISKVSLVTANNQKFLIVHGKGQSPSIRPLHNNEHSDETLVESEAGIVS